MYPVSSQRKNWTFTNEEEIDSLRRNANQRFIHKFGGNQTEEEENAFFLTPEEELILLKGSELILREFCRKFLPPMPKSVIGTSYHYFKRFYINNSVMDYHPKEILVTCVYLACKVEEFNISIVQFVSNIKGDREKAAEIILSNELLLMQQINYYLTVHNPYRPVEGLIIDIKTRYPQLREPERLRGGIDEFIEKVYQTDIILLYSPSQIALAAVLHGASNIQENLDLYVTETLFGCDKQYLARIIEAVRNIRLKVKMIEIPAREITKTLEDKLSRCRNQENNPDSEVYKRKKLDLLNEEDERQVRKYAKISERMRSTQNKFFGMSLSVEELIISAKKLANSLKDNETKVDSLINQSKYIYGQIEAMKQYTEDVEKLNEAASQRPHSVLVAGLQRESEHLRELQAENSKLRSALGDHQNAIELIMSKYRQQVSQLMSEIKTSSSILTSAPECTKIITNQYSQINRMRQVMREAAEADESSYIKDQELISRLITENRGLRELLKIYNTFGNYQSVDSEEEQVSGQATEKKKC